MDNHPQKVENNKLKKDEYSFMDRYLQEELTPIYQDLDAAIKELRSEPTVDERQVNVCLLSRSAFTDFYSLSVLQHRIDDWAKGELERMFQEALALLPSNCRYRKSVGDRHEEFLMFCENVESRDRLDTADWPAVAGR